MYLLKRTSTFKKQSKKYKNELEVKLKLKEVFKFLLNNEKLPEKYKDHQLKGPFKEYRECHISPDILLIYKKNEVSKTIILAYIGSHSNLFK